MHNTNKNNASECTDNVEKVDFLFSYLLLVYILYGIENTFRKYKLDFLDCCCNFNNKMTSTTLVITLFFSNLTFQRYYDVTICFHGNLYLTVAIMYVETKWNHGV